MSDSSDHGKNQIEIKSSVVDPSNFRMDPDPDPGFWILADPDPDPGPQKQAKNSVFRAF